MKTKINGINKKRKYTYYLTEPIGKNFQKDFKPELTPKQMLELGVFGGFYWDKSWLKEFPKSWHKNAKLNEDFCKDKNFNFFKIRASQPLNVWVKKGWINKNDPLGWFQWYCRYYFGRRIDDDIRQIKRWKAFTRHIGQIKKNCKKGDLTCRPKQRQALIHWAYDSRKI